MRNKAKYYKEKRDQSRLIIVYIIKRSEKNPLAADVNKFTIKIRIYILRCNIPNYLRADRFDATNILFLFFFSFFSSFFFLIQIRDHTPLALTILPISLFSTCSWNEVEPGPHRNKSSGRSQ